MISFSHFSISGEIKFPHFGAFVAEGDDMTHHAALLSSCVPVFRISVSVPKRAGFVFCVMRWT